jgi:hypothetical protein
VSGKRLCACFRVVCVCCVEANSKLAKGYISIVSLQLSSIFVCKDPIITGDSEIIKQGGQMHDQV